MTTPTTQREADERTEGVDLDKLRALIDNDGYAMTFQSLGQYRTALIKEIQTLPRVAEQAEDAVVEANRQLLLDRSRVGLKKYGVPLANSTLSLGQVAQHALEEALDLANYLQTIIHNGLATRQAAPEAPAAATDQPSAGQMAERVCTTCYGEGWVRDLHDMEQGMVRCPRCMGRASLPPTAPAEPIIDVAFGIKDASGPATQVIPAKSVMRHADGSYTVFIDAPAPSTPTAPQAASQQAELVHQMRSLTGHGEWQQTDADGATSIKRMPHWADLYEFRTLQVIAPQAATTAACQPSTLTGQPDAAICQPAATTASAGTPTCVVVGYKGKPLCENSCAIKGHCIWSNHTQSGPLGSAQLSALVDMYRKGAVLEDVFQRAAALARAPLPAQQVQAVDVARDAAPMTKAQIDEIVYRCRQNGNDTTYDIVNAAIRSRTNTTGGSDA